MLLPKRITQATGEGESQIPSGRTACNLVTQAWHKSGAVGSLVPAIHVLETARRLYEDREPDERRLKSLTGDLYPQPEWPCQKGHDHWDAAPFSPSDYAEARSALNALFTVFRNPARAVLERSARPSAWIALGLGLMLARLGVAYVCRAEADKKKLARTAD